MLPVGLELSEGVARASKTAVFCGGDPRTAVITTVGDGKGCNGGGRGGVGGWRSPEIGLASQASVASGANRPTGLAIEAIHGVTGSPNLESDLVTNSINGAKCTPGKEVGGGLSGA